MVSKFFHPARSLLTVAFLTAVAGADAVGQEKQTSAAPEQPAAQETGSGKAAETHRLRDLEQSIFKPFRTLEPEGSLDGVIEQPQRPVPVPNKRAKEMMERRKNWAFMTPEEMILGKSSDDPLDSKEAAKDENENKMLSPMDRYFQRLYGHDKDKANSNRRGGKNDAFGTGKSGSTNDDFDDPDNSTSGLPESVRETQRSLKKNGDGKEKKDLEKRSWGFFSDVFALERNKPTPEEERVERERMEAYRKSLGLDPTPTFGATFSPTFADPDDPYRIALPPALMNSTPAGPAPSPSITHASPTANPFLDSSSKGAAPSSLTPALPKVDPPKSSLPPQPTFAAPRRSF